MFYKITRIGILIFCVELGFATVGYAAQKLTIPQIQGSGHISPYERQLVSFEGVVTAATRNGFHLYDPAGDGDDATSDGILVKRKNHNLNVGDRVRVEGQVEEQSAFGGQTGRSVTAIRKAVTWKLSSGEETVPVVLGVEGRLPPTEAIFSPLGNADHATFGIDFYESLEGTYLRIEQPVVVGPMNRFNEFYIVANGGANATGMNSVGGISLTPGDSNPEILQIQLVGRELDPNDFQVGVGDTFAFLEGVLSYDRGLYQLELVKAGDLEKKTWVHEPIGQPPSEEALTIASYNVENLDPKIEDQALAPTKNDIDDDVGDGKFAAIANQIVTLLGSPDIIALQEVQDDDGAEFSETTSSDKTLSVLVEAILTAGGPKYLPAWKDPVDDSDGGQPGGNIRVAFLYNPTRVALDKTSLARIDGQAFEQSRLPLTATFSFNNVEVHVINTHLSSKGGSDPQYGVVQPPQDRSLQKRLAQTRTIREHIRLIPEVDNQTVVALGDFNSYWFEEPMLLLTGGDPAMTNLTTKLPPLERISYVFQGNSQSLDHALVLLGSSLTATLQTAHVNAVMPESARFSDHDPKLVTLSTK